MRYHISTYAVLIVLAAATSVAATTWTVEADGSGDFPTLQDAEIASSPGDTIQLGPGLFDDYSTYQYGDSYLAVSTDNLTLRGAGKDVSIIGQSDSDHHVNDLYVIFLDSGLSLTIEDLTLQPLDWARSTLIRASSCQLVATRCGFRDADDGIRLGDTQFEITDCEFSHIPGKAVSVRPVAASAIRNVVFNPVRGAIYTTGDVRLDVSDCHFDGSVNGGGSYGVYSEGDGNIALERCTFVNHDRAAALVGGRYFEMNDCEIDEEVGHGLEFYDGLFKGSGNTIYSATIALICNWGVYNDGFRNNLILTDAASQDGGLLVRTYVECDQPYTVDLEGNAWGTYSSDVIAMLIHDSNDDPDLCVAVDVEPFVGGPVRTEQHSWSTVKDLFR